MLFKTVSFGEKYPNSNLTFYVHEEDSSPRPAIVVCPGGGYRFLSVREAQPIAEFFYNNGMNVYLLRYSVAPYASEYRPLIEAALSIKLIRELAKEHNTDPEKIITCGFSAGGHLAASAGILWNIPEVRDAVGVTDGTSPEGINRPNGMILSYPVITAGKYAHRGSIDNLMGRGGYALEEADKFSLELSVNETTPPMFIWHTVTDTCVPVQNSTMLINTYIENKLSFEAHIYPYGHHGLSLADERTWEGNPDSVNPHVATWAELSLMWIKDVFK